MSSHQVLLQNQALQHNIILMVD